MNTLLHVEQLAINSQEQCLVDPVSFHLASGEAITILGETGSGKSLLANAIIGTLPNELTLQGNITLFGKNQNSRSQAERQALWGKKISILPQEPWYALSPLMNVGEQVREVHTLVNHNAAQANEKTQAAFNQVELSQDQEKYPHQISGGMAQRVAYLCATQAGGELLIADEPTKGLDSSRRDQIIEQLLTHKQRGAVLTITHDVEVADRLGGEIIVMRKGVIQERGPAEQVLKHPQSDYTKALIAADPHFWEKRSKSQIGEPLLTVHQLTKGFAKRTLFRDLNFTLSSGEVLGISGDSGCGKSTLADLLLRLQSPCSGGITFHQKIKVAEALKLYQDPPSALAKHCTLQTLLNDLEQRHAIDKQAIPILMAKLNLSPDLLLRQATQISGGELQRFAILRALLMKPKLLIADEPTSRLDPVTAANTLELMLDLTQQIGCALVLISHDKVALEKRCHKVVQL